MEKLLQGTQPALYCPGATEIRSMAMKRILLTIAGCGCLVAAAQTVRAAEDHQILTRAREPRYVYLGNHALGDYRWRHTPILQDLAKPDLGDNYDRWSGEFTGPHNS